MTFLGSNNLTFALFLFVAFVLVFPGLLFAEVGVDTGAGIGSSSILIIDVIDVLLGEGLIGDWV